MRLFCLLFIWTFISCKHKAQKQPDIHYDSSVFTIIAYDSSLKCIFENVESTVLTKDDFFSIDSLLINSIEQYNKEQETQYSSLKTEHPKSTIERSNFVIDLARYKRQYIPVVDSNGDKIVWVNCVCDVTDTFWKLDIIEVSDGGNCYFNVKLNLAKRTWFDLYVNGES